MVKSNIPRCAAGDIYDNIPRSDLRQWAASQIFRKVASAKMSGKKRFLILSDEELEIKSKAQKNVNTDKSEKRADKAFRNFLIPCGREENDCDYWDFTEESLDDYLAKFWFGARKSIIVDIDEDEDEQDKEKKNRLYSANTLKNYRYTLGRLIRRNSSAKGKDIMVKDANCFPKSQQAFEDALKEF